MIRIRFEGSFSARQRSDTPSRFSPENLSNRGSDFNRKGGAVRSGRDNIAFCAGRRRATERRQLAPVPGTADSRGLTRVYAIGAGQIDEPGDQLMRSMIRLTYA